MVPVEHVRDKKQKTGWHCCYLKCFSNHNGKTVLKGPIFSVILFIGTESDHWLPLSLTDSLTISCLVYFIYVTLACEDANSNLLDVATVADDDAGKQQLRQFGADLESEVCS